MLVLGANLTTDRTWRMRNLVPGNVQRPRSVEVTPGGKAVNVCRAAAVLGVRARLVANLPGRTGALVGDLLDAAEHDVRRVCTSGEARTAVIVLEDSGRVSVINEPGPPLTEGDRDALLAALAEEVPGHRVTVAAGSLPPQAPDDLYAQATRLTAAGGSLMIIDAARTALRAGLAAAPDVVTPNLAEAQAVLTDRDHPEADDEPVEPVVGDIRAAAAEAAAGLRRAGARAALVTVGRHGVAADTPDGTFWVCAPEVTEVNPIGAGDAFVGGLGVALERGDSLPEATVLAVAVAAASVAHPIAGAADPALVARLRRGLRWEPA